MHVIKAPASSGAFFVAERLRERSRARLPAQDQPAAPDLVSAVAFKGFSAPLDVFAVP
jgi:hypothetical protein